MEKTALLLVDFQNDYFPSFQGAKWPLQETEKASSNGAALLKAFREQGLPIVHVRHEFATQDAPFFQPDSDGARIHDSVKPDENEPVILKHDISSFKQTNLRETLEQLGVETLVVAGAMSHMCIDSVTREASDLGYKCHVAHDACATLDVEFNGVTVPAQQVHAAFMAALSFGYCNVRTTQELLSGIST